MNLRAPILLLAVTAPASTRYFVYQRPIVGSSASAAQSCVTMDADVFAHSTAQLGDLRLYQGSRETPYVIRAASPVEAVMKAITPLNLGSRGQSTVFDSAMPEGKYSDVELDVAGQNFLATVTVSGRSVQAGGPVTTLGSFTIFDLTDQKLGRSTVLHLPQSDFRYLHFTVAGQLSPRNILGLSVERLPENEPKYVAVAASSQIRTQDRLSVVEITTPAHVPVDRVTFAVGAEPAAFTRDVTITASPIGPASGDGILPATTFSGNLLRLHRVEGGHRIDEERLSLEAPRASFDSPTKWTIHIENGNDAPLMPQSVRLEMLERQLCFQAEADASYALYYGDAALSAPRYDYAALFIERPDALQASLGAETRNPGFEARPDARPFTEKHPGLLWAALVGVIGLLAAIAFRSAMPPMKTP